MKQNESSRYLSDGQERGAKRERKKKERNNPENWLRHHALGKAIYFAHRILLRQISNCCFFLFLFSLSCRPDLLSWIEFVCVYDQVLSTKSVQVAGTGVVIIVSRKRKTVTNDYFATVNETERMCVHLTDCTTTTKIVGQFVMSEWSWREKERRRRWRSELAMLIECTFICTLMNLMTICVFVLLARKKFKSKMIHEVLRSLIKY